MDDVWQAALMSGDGAGTVVPVTGDGSRPPEILAETDTVGAYPPGEWHLTDFDADARTAKYEDRSA